MARAAAQIVPTEPWFVEPRPQGNELVSILIVSATACLEQTRPCLESLLRHSRSPYELILVTLRMPVDGVQGVFGGIPPPHRPGARRR